jgi:hypothetical protein
MKNWRTVIVIVLTALLFWFVKFILGFPSADLEVISVILTIASILFGFLVGFFISELWTRYIEIRSLQGVRTSSNINMIRYASYFYKGNKKFEQKFKSLVEISAISDEIIEWDEGHLEIPYHRAIEDSFRLVKLKQNNKDQVYFDNLLDSYHELVESLVKLDTLYKERLFISEWFLIASLSVIIAFSTLFLNVDHFFTKVIVVAFPAIIVTALAIIYDLDTLVWGRGIITIEPSQLILESIGRERFYITRDKKYIPHSVTAYRTEHDLKGELLKVYENITIHKKVEH